MPKKRYNLTKATIDALPLPAKGRAFFPDSKCEDLALRVSNVGGKLWYFHGYGFGGVIDICLGKYPALTREQAETMVKELSNQVARKIDPRLEKNKSKVELTFEELFDWYLETYSKPVKESWKRDEERFKNHLGPIAKLKLSKVTRSILRDLHEKIGKKEIKSGVRSGGVYAANRTLALISVVFSKAIKREKFSGANPAQGIEPFPEASRERRLTKAEASLLIATISEETSTVGDYILMALLSGVRRSNLLAMRWDEIDFKENTWFIPKTKNGKSQTIPLASAEVQILLDRKKNATSDWVFPSGRSSKGHMTKPEKGWESIQKRIGLSNVHIHDLRRSLGSFQADTGASTLVIGKTLNHLSPKTTAIYARLSLEPVREAKAKAHEAMMDGLVTDSALPRD